MSVDEQARYRLRQRLVDVLGEPEASTLMEAVPPVPWSDVATKSYVDERVTQAEERLTATLRTELNEATTHWRAELHEATTHRQAELRAATTHWQAGLHAATTSYQAALHDVTTMFRADLHDQSAVFRTDLQGAITAQTRQLFFGITGLLLAVAAVIASISLL